MKRYSVPCIAFINKLDRYMQINIFNTYNWVFGAISLQYGVF